MFVSEVPKMDPASNKYLDFQLNEPNEYKQPNELYPLDH
jgi:hypothetical protein